MLAFYVEWHIVKDYRTCCLKMNGSERICCSPGTSQGSDQKNDWPVHSFHVVEGYGLDMSESGSEGSGTFIVRTQIRAGF